ncbi:MAG: FkbM family methyltransferase [Patescibacteria group bacterium]|nr:FkbM family methyltransferase [Patescibacteria group bacterium]
MTLGPTLDKLQKNTGSCFPKQLFTDLNHIHHIFHEYAKDFSADKRIKPFNIALSNNNGKSLFYINDNHYTNSLMPINKNNGKDTLSNITIDKIDVTTETIDSFCFRNGIDQIDILKIDVQGGELLVLEGAKDKLKNGEVTLIYTEVEFSPLYVNQPLFNDIEKYLLEFGFKLNKIYYEKNNVSGKFISGNAIFTKELLK